MKEPLPPLEFHPLTPDRWADLEALFGPRGACAGCWCMWWRLPNKEWTVHKYEGNRLAFRALVDGGSEPGLIAYAGGKPVGWCAVAPREEYVVLERSRLLGRIDATPVWSVTCFFIARGWRRRGLTVALLQAAIDFVRARGGKVVEGYPQVPRATMPDAWAYVGLTHAYLAAGFTEVARPSPARAIMRYEV